MWRIGRLPLAVTLIVGALIFIAVIDRGGIAKCKRDVC